MSVSTHTPNRGHDPAGTRHSCGCRVEDVVLERNRYFTGKFMAARDFAADTEYLLNRHRLHNRLLHGWGIVCGLVPEHHPRPECKDWVVVESGFAIDCYGRELVLDKETPFRLPLGDATEPFLLCARFTQEKIEPVPALYAEGTCDPHRQEFNRYRDGVELVVAEVTHGCWPIDDDCGCHHDDDSSADAADAETTEESGERGGHHHHHHGCCGDHEPHKHECLTPMCPCADLVPLARVIPLEDGGYRLDLEGRRVQPPPAALLTHITRVNWQHGGELSLRELRHELDGELRIRFDRPLREYRRDPARGVNPHTFVVQYASGPNETLEFLPYPDDCPPRLVDDCTAVFTIDRDYLTDRGRRALHGATIYVSLRCDFIPDCRGIPVDGNHLRGRLPSGNGVQGGLFESWFRVRGHRDDGDHRDEEQGAES